MTGSTTIQLSVLNENPHNSYDLIRTVRSNVKSFNPVSVVIQHILM